MEGYRSKRANSWKKEVNFEEKMKISLEKLIGKKNSVTAHFCVGLQME